MAALDMQTVTVDVETVLAWTEAINRLGISSHAANDAFYELCRVIEEATLKEWTAAFGEADE